MSELDTERDSMSNKGQKLYKFVISGGPCAGKTTAMERLPIYLTERGFRVFTVPEAATMAWLNGARFADIEKPECAYAFQQFVIRTQMQLEDSFMNFARSTGKDAILLCDRGTMDGSAYVSKEEFGKLLAEVGLDEITARDQRYNAVYHLVTAADGAEAFYSLANNKGRSEDMEAAKGQDRRTQEVWTGHPRHFIIDNRNTFEQKIERLISLISMQVGLPSLARKAFKYLIRRPDISQLPGVEVFDVEKIILAKSFSTEEDGSHQYEEDCEGEFDGQRGGRGEADVDIEASATATTTPTPTAPEVGSRGAGQVLYSFIRRRSQNSSHSYGLTTVKRLQNGEVVELKNVITSRVYEFLKRTAADKTRRTMLQKRYYFLYKKQSFQLYEHLFENSLDTPVAAPEPAPATTAAAETGSGGGGIATDSPKGLSRGLTMNSGTRGFQIPSTTSSSLLTALEGDLWTLYCQCQGECPEFPPFITVEHEVTNEDDGKFSAYNLSRINKNAASRAGSIVE